MNQTIIMGDHYETPRRAYEDIASLIAGRFQRIYDPFYCEGRCKQYIQEVLGGEVLHEPVDGFQRIDPNTFDVIVTNPPFTRKYEVISFLAEYGKPIMILLPFETICTLKYKALHQPGWQLIVPSRRIQFEQQGKTVRTNFHCVWLCMNMDFPDDFMIV
jgi:hypothetical protein